MNMQTEDLMQKALHADVKNRLIVGVSSAALAASLITLGMPANITPAYADSAAELQAQADAALQELTSMQDVANSYYNEYIQALADYEQAARLRDEAKAQIDELNDQIADIQDRLGDRARSMYRSGSSSSLDLLLGATSFEEFTTSWDLLGRMNENDADLVQQAKDLREEAAKKQEEYDKQAATAQTKADEASQLYEKANETILQMQASYDNLSAEAQSAYAAESAYAQAAAAYGATINSDGTVYDSTTGQTYSSVSSYTAATGNSIVDRARAMIGSAYVWGGTGGSWGGFDCSGLVSYAITGQTGNRLGNTYTFMGYNQATTAQPGDLVVNGGHVAIVSGVDANGKVTSIIHAVNQQQGVAETGMNGYFSEGDYTIVRPN